MRRYDEILADARTAQALAEDFAIALAATARDDASMHRLWYDLRSQSTFSESLRADVLQIDNTLQQMIWRIVQRYAALGGTTPTVAAPTAYAIFDGVFQNALLHHLAGDRGALAGLSDQARELLPRLVDVDPAARGRFLPA